MRVIALIGDPQAVETMMARDGDAIGAGERIPSKAVFMR
jgi:hypothetical protein